ncbi:hypothetical protein JL720_14625 [Aureococcus anophagefferens]|nr:hypothetical protein JL720_14625 [Aureococcus anophagefferens]
MPDTRSAPDQVLGALREVQGRDDRRRVPRPRGTLADLAHDTGKGFVQYADKKSHKPPNFPRAAAQKAPLSAEEKAWQTWDDDELDDVCDTCGEYTVTDRRPMSNVLICDAARPRDAPALLVTAHAPDDEGYRCVNCVDGTSGGEVDRPASARARRR